MAAFKCCNRTISIASNSTGAGSALKMIQIGILLLGSTMLVEMYFQNREVEIFRSQGGFIADETIDKLSENIDYRDSDQKSDESLFCELDKYRQKNQVDVRSEVNVSGISFERRNKGHLAELSDVDGETIMHLAAAKGKVEVVRYLLEVGEDADIRTRDVQSNPNMLYRDTRQTPLHYAAAFGNVEVMQVLVDYGADISAMTESGDTALHKAALHGHTSAVRWLLDNGADLGAKNVFGATPLSMALINQRKEVAVVLLVQGKAKDVSLRNPLSKGAISPMFFLLEAFLLLIFKVLNS